MPRQFPSCLLLTRTSFRAAIRFAVSFADTFPSSPSFPVKRQHPSAPKIRVRRPSINRARNRHTGSKNSQHVSFSATSSPGPSHPPVRYSSSEDVRRFRRTAFCPTNCCPGIHASIRRAYSSIRSHFSVLPSLPVGGCADTLIPPDVLANRISKFESDCPVRDSRASHEICPRFRRVEKGRALFATVSFFFRFLHRPSALSTSA